MSARSACWYVKPDIHGARLQRVNYPVCPWVPWQGGAEQLELDCYHYVELQLAQVQSGVLHELLAPAAACFINFGKPWSVGSHTSLTFLFLTLDGLNSF